MREVDVFISGGGVAGLTAAVALTDLGLSVLLADPAPQVVDPGAPGADLRTTAILAPGRRFLSELGLWDALAPHATALSTMRIVDAAATPPVTRDFTAAEIEAEDFGANIPNWRLRQALLDRLAPGTLAQTGFADILTRDREALVTLGDGTRLRTRLAIAADGRNSPLREALGIGVARRRYGQKALVFAVTHDRPHDGVSIEVHRTGGPFTLVPLPDHEGRPCSSVVWMTDGPEAERLAALPPDAFAEEVNDRSAGVMGPLTPLGRPQAWPIIAQKADRLSARRAALIAEAAHVVPPIGAQGFNMSLADIETLRDLIRARPSGLGDAEMLDAYARARGSDVALRFHGIDLLNRTSQSGAALRGTGIELLADVAPLKSLAMRLGLGAR